LFRESVGDVVGFLVVPVGELVGSFVGKLVGCSAMFSVGKLVGYEVGKLVGYNVGLSMCCGFPVG